MRWHPRHRHERRGTNGTIFCLPQNVREAERRKAHPRETAPSDAARLQVFSIPVCREDRGGGARLSALHRGYAPMPVRPRLGFGPRFLESPSANGRTLLGTSAASTSRTGHAPDGTMPKAARGAVYGRAKREPLPLRPQEYPRDRRPSRRAGFELRFVTENVTIVKEKATAAFLRRFDSRNDEFSRPGNVARHRKHTPAAARVSHCFPIDFDFSLL